DCEYMDRESNNPPLISKDYSYSTVPYTFNNSGFRHWISNLADKYHKSAVGPNYLAILTLVWSYILSVWLLET
ncbi:hypothetical protein V8F44DRAFT_505192, partial [Aspergillus fumigatus]